MLRVTQNLFGRPLLDHSTEVHHDDSVGDIPRQTEVVGHDEQREPQLFAQPQHEREDLAAHRRVQAADRLVGDDDLWVERECAGNDDAQAASGSAGGGKALRQKGDDASRNAVPRQATGSAADAEGPGARSAELAEVAKQIKERWRRFGKSYEAQSVLPTREWLVAIPDDPGKFLKLRLAAEQARRLARGGSARESVR